MEILTDDEFTKQRGQDCYWRGRWEYFAAAGRLIADVPPGDVLEIGPYTIPLLCESRIMDIRHFVPDVSIDDTYCRTVIHDARDTPFPFDDKSFDLVVALQVWEHLGTRQAEAFAEVRRISKRFLMSVPYQWTVGEPSHRHIDQQTIDAWANGDAPKRIEKVKGNVQGQDRIVLLYDWTE